MFKSACHLICSLRCSSWERFLLVSLCMMSISGALEPGSGTCSSFGSISFRETSFRCLLTDVLTQFICDHAQRSKLAVREVHRTCIDVNSAVGHQSGTRTPHKLHRRGTAFFYSSDTFLNNLLHFNVCFELCLDSALICRMNEINKSFKKVYILVLFCSHELSFYLNT